MTNKTLKFAKIVTSDQINRSVIKDTELTRAFILVGYKKNNNSYILDFSLTYSLR